MMIIIKTVNDNEKLTVALVFNSCDTLENGD